MIIEKNPHPDSLHQQTALAWILSFFFLMSLFPSSDDHSKDLKRLGMPCHVYASHVMSHHVYTCQRASCPSFLLRYIAWELWYSTCNSGKQVHGVCWQELRKYYHVREANKPCLSGQGILYSEGRMLGHLYPLGSSSARHIPM